jgi:hypothetical protein
MKESNSQKAMGGFNSATGTTNAGFSRGTNKYAGNQHAGIQNVNTLINKGRGPTVGNESDDNSTYPDAARVPKSGKGKDMFMGSANPQVRTPGGTRAWDPVCGQNYRGNADKIDFPRGPTKGNQR